MRLPLLVRRAAMPAQPKETAGLLVFASRDSDESGIVFIDRVDLNFGLGLAFPPLDLAVTPRRIEGHGIE